MAKSIKENHEKLQRKFRKSNKKKSARASALNFSKKSFKEKKTANKNQLHVSSRKFQKKVSRKKSLTKKINYHDLNLKEEIKKNKTQEYQNYQKEYPQTCRQNFKKRVVNPSLVNQALKNKSKQHLI